MKDTLAIPCVSTVEPLFSIVDGHPVCTRTWQCAADPKLSEGQTVKVGSTDCRVTGHASDSRVVTYKFSPMNDVRLIKIKCEACDHLYSICDPVCIGGVPHIGTKVSTEVGCPKCLEPDGTIVD